MDVSSRYFSLLKQPNRFWLRHLWHFLLTIHQVGKTRELISFALWEFFHLSYLYRLSGSYLKFTPEETKQSSLEAADLVQKPALTTDLLQQQGLHFQAIAIDWKYCYQTSSHVIWGCRYSQLTKLYYSTNQSESATLAYTFAHPITSLFISRQNTLFVCSNGVIYRSDDQGISFTTVLSLSTSISYFLFNNGMTELPDGTLIIGEYGSIWEKKAWQNLAFLYYSFDGGMTWQNSDFLIQQGVNKHIHLVKYCHQLKATILTDGDNKKQFWINKNSSYLQKRSRVSTDGWRRINRFHHQTGGYTSMAETDEVVLFGSDYLGGTNFIVSTTDGKKFQKFVLPDPYRRSPVMNMVIRKTETSTEVWAASFSCLTDDARSLLMCTTDSGQSWTRVIDVQGTKNEVRLVSASTNPTNVLYISVTTFGDSPSQHIHQVYRLDPITSASETNRQMPYVSSAAL